MESTSQTMALVIDPQESPAERYRLNPFHPVHVTLIS